MTQKENTVWPDAVSMVKAADALLHGMNEGLLIYRAESMDDPVALRLLYANADASRFTGSDLNPVIGKKIGEAFPSLLETELPQAFLDVVRNQKSIKIGATEYEDDTLEKAYYSVKAFPMPNDCVGVIFENIGLRKQVDQMVRKLNDSLKKKNEGLLAALVTIRDLSDGILAGAKSSMNKSDPKSGSDSKKLLNAAEKLSSLVSGLLKK